MPDSSNPYSVGPSVNYAAPLLNFMGPANAIQGQKQKQQQPGPNAQPGAPMSLAPPNPGGAPGMPQAAPGSGTGASPPGLAQVLQRMFGGGGGQQQPGAYMPNGPAPIERVDINGRPIAGPNAATGIY